MKVKNGTVGNGSLAFLTSCDLNYVAQAAVLAESTKRFYPNSIFILGLNEHDLNLSSDLSEIVKSFDQVCVGTKLHPNFDALSKRYGIIELCCSTKPNLFQIAFKQNFQRVIYLDPDTCLYGKLDLVEKAFEEDYEAILTPHLKNLGNFDMEISAMAHGVFNLGFLALRKNLNTSKFLTWWDSRLELYCIRDHQRGIFTDQSWAGLIVGALNTLVIRDAGYNFATWNLQDHKINSKKTGYFVDRVPLTFMHFSGYKSKSIYNVIAKFKIDNHQNYDFLYQEYSKLVAGYESLLARMLANPKSKKHYKKHFYLRLTLRDTKVKAIGILNKLSPASVRVLVKIKQRTYLPRK